MSRLINSYLYLDDVDFSLNYHTCACILEFGILQDRSLSLGCGVQAKEVTT
jgi:hypothetical protein